MAFGVTFCVNVALLLLISPSSTTTAGPALVPFRYWTGWYMPRAAASPAEAEAPVAGAGELPYRAADPGAPQPTAPDSSVRAAKRAVFSLANF